MDLLEWQVTAGSKHSYRLELWRHVDDLSGDRIAPNFDFDWPMWRIDGRDLSVEDGSFDRLEAQSDGRRLSQDGLGDGRSLLFIAQRMEHDSGTALFHRG